MAAPDAPERQIRETLMKQATSKRAGRLRTAIQAVLMLVGSSLVVAAFLSGLGGSLASSI